MTASPLSPLNPRKLPVQARSETTVLAIFEASIQVLLSVGYRKLTTSCVAERAGVSVGTLYQYFPNRQSLIRAVLERYLAEMSASIEAECRSLYGRSLDETAAGLVDAFIAAKWKRLEVSRAMHEPLVEVGGAELVRASAAKGRRSPPGSLEKLPRDRPRRRPAPRRLPRDGLHIDAAGGLHSVCRRQGNDSARTCTRWRGAICERCVHPEITAGLRRERATLSTA